MLEGIARLAIRAPRRIIAIALLVMAGAAVFGIPAANSLSAGGFADPTADSAHAAQLLADKFDQGDTQMLITVSSHERRAKRCRPRCRHRHRAQGCTTRLKWRR